MFSIKVINFISLFLQSITDTLLLWFKWEIPLAGLSQGQNKTIFSDFTESIRGEFCDSQSSTDTQEHFASEGQPSSEGDSLQVPAWPVPPVCSASVPFHVTAGVFVQPLSPAPRRRWLHSQGSNHSLARLLSVRAKFAVTKTEELLQIQSPQLLRSLPIVDDRQLLLSSRQEMGCK